MNKPINLRRIALPVSVLVGVSEALLCWISFVDGHALQLGPVCLAVGLASAAVVWLAMLPVGWALRRWSSAVVKDPLITRRDLKRAAAAGLGLAALMGAAPFLEKHRPGACPDLALDFQLALPPAPFHVGERPWYALSAENTGCKPLHLHGDLFLSDEPSNWSGRPIDGTVAVSISDKKGEPLPSSPASTTSPDDWADGTDAAFNRRFRLQFAASLKAPLRRLGPYAARLSRSIGYFTLAPGEKIEAAPTLRADSGKQYLGRYRLVRGSYFRKPGEYFIEAHFQGSSSLQRIHSPRLKFEVLP